MRRDRDLWLWAGASLTAFSLTLLAVAGGLLAARDNYPFWGSSPMIAAYASGALALVCFVAAVRDLPFPFGRVEEAPVAQEPSREIPVSDTQDAARGWRLVRTSSTNDDHFPSIESAVDSFGNRAEPRLGDKNSWSAQPMRVLRPGQRVSFQLEVSDPNGEDVAMRVLPSAGKADVAISPDGTIAWNVREENIADPAHVHIYVRSHRNYHRYEDWDASASFIYRVLPRLAPKVQP